MNFTKILKNAFVIVVALTFINAVLPDELTFEDFDKNSDELIARSEFVDAFTYHYVDDWNTTDNDYLDDEDFYEVVYHVWDSDDDGRLTDEEWQVGYDNYFADYIVVEYDDIDVDVDGYIVYDEYYNVIDDTEFFADWDFDTDMQLSQNELARGVFNNWDVDDSGFISESEFNDFDIYYLDI